MADKKIRVGIIGLGYAGKRHLKGFSESGVCEICFLCDNDAAALNDAIGFLSGNPGIDTEGFLDHKEAIRKSRPDAVVVATPNESHVEIAKHALLLGISVLVEKPVCESVMEAEELGTLAEEKGVILMVNHTDVYDRHVNKLIELAGKRKVRRIESVRAGGDFSPKHDSKSNLKDMENALFDRLVHQTAAVNAICSCEVSRAVVYEKELSSRMHKLFSTVEFENGAVADIKILTVPKTSLLKKLRLTGDGFEILYKLNKSGAFLKLKENGKTTDVMTGLDGDDFQNTANSFLDAISKQKSPLADARNGTLTVGLSRRLMESHEKDLGRIRRLMEEDDVRGFISFAKGFKGLKPEFMKLISSNDAESFLNSERFLKFRRLGFLLSKVPEERLESLIDKIISNPTHEAIGEEYSKRLSDGSELVRLNLECNQGCLFCNVQGAERPINRSRLRSLLEESAKRNFQVIFTGGEPTISKNFLSIVRFASRMGFTEINLQTNAVTSSDPNYALELVLAGVNFALVSLHSHDPQISDRLTNAPGTFHKTVEGIRNLSRLGVDVTLAHVINTKNYTGIVDYIDFVHENLWDVRKIDLLFNAFRARGKQHPELLARLSDSAPYVEEGYARAVELGISLRNAFSFPLCYFGFGLFRSSEFKLLKRLSEAGSKMPRHLEILSREKHKAEACSRCIYNEFCLGMWKPYVEQYSDSELKPFLDSCKAPEYGFSGGFVIYKGKRSAGEVLLGLRRGEYENHAGDSAGDSKGEAKGINAPVGSRQGAPMDMNGAKTLIFKNIMNCKDKEDVDWFYQGSLYLASSLSRAGFGVKISDSRISLENNMAITDEAGFIEDLKDDVNLVVISLSEFYLDNVRRLCRIIRKHSDAYIAVGGIMATNSPEHVLVHLPEADFVIRGAGERALPRLVKAIEGKTRDEGIKTRQINALLGIKGLFANLPDYLISSDSDQINYLDNLDETKIDFSFLSKKNISEGLNLSTSRGCFNSCLFCTTVGRGRYRAMSYAGLVELLSEYEKRLVAIYGNPEDIPENAFKLSFNDDDFLGDKRRAGLFFGFVRRSRYKINFIQTAIRSFYVRSSLLGGGEPELDHDILDCLGPDLFHPDSDYNIYIGTENLADEEIRRLNKGYSYKYIKKVVHELSSRQIKQGHHLIYCNPETRISNVFDNMIKITRLRVRYKGYFNVLLPIIKSQVSLFSTASFKKYFNLGQIRAAKVLKITGLPEFDYPVVDRDIPKDRIVYMLSEISEKIFSGEKYHLTSWTKTLMFLLENAERLSLSDDKEEKSLAEKMYFLADAYSDYPRIIFPEKKLRRKAFNPERNNLELMMTRRCQLRCRYCPVDKRDESISLENIKRSIDLLMKSGSESVRVDFLGGEPLLCFDLMKESIMYAEAQAKSHGKKVSYFMITNTLNLDDQMLDFIRRYDFLLELSLDGDEKTHNEFKIPAKGKLNPYQTMAKKFDRILKSGIRNYVIMVVTPKTVERLLSNFSHIRAFGFQSIHINYSFGTMWSDDELESFLMGLDLIKSRFWDELVDGSLRLGNLETRKEPAIINSEMMVDCDGSLHLMSEWIFENSKINNDDFTIGKVDETESFADLFFDDFMSYHVLSMKYTRNDERLRRLILNNIDVGRRFKAYFDSLKDEINIAKTKTHMVFEQKDEVSNGEETRT